MRPIRKAKRKATPEPSPEDTQEMFAAGQRGPEDPEETREYDAVEVGRGAEESPGGDGLPDAADGEDLPDEENGPIGSGESPEDDLPESGEVPDEFEDEDWDDEELEEWDDEPDEPEPADRDAEPAKSRVEDFKAWLVRAGSRTAEAWKAFWKKVGEIRLPRHEIDGQKVLAGAGILALAAMVGAGGFVLGKGTGDDLDQARLEGEFAGKRAGAIEGATKGYAAGFKKGRDIAFRKAYSASYKRNYIRAYDKAGMDAPEPEDIEVPEP